MKSEGIGSVSVQTGAALVLGWWVLIGSVGCSGEGSYGLHLVFPDEQSRAVVERVVVWALDPGGHDCAEMVAGGILPEELRELARVEIKAPFKAGAPLSRVPAGEVMFVAEGRASEGTRLLRGCFEAQVKGGTTVEVTIELECVCEPVAGTCGPVAEVMGNGIDDDCDGQTDECSVDMDCNDDNGCTSDFCSDGECHHSNFPDGLQCSDNDACTTDDACKDGVCSGREKDCSGTDFGMCFVGVCNEESGACEVQAAEDGTSCDDGNWCTINDVCAGGVCVGTTRDCLDEDGCTKDVCDENLGRCTHVVQPKPGAEGPPSTCSNGLDDDCDGLVDEHDPNCFVCTIDSDCNDNNQCTIDECVDSKCRNTPVEEFTPCPDDSFCNGEEVCYGGVCISPGNPCPGADGDGDCAESCDEGEDNCLAPDQDGAACDDGQWCTVADACASGACGGSERDCADGADCTLDICDENQDQCIHVLQPNPGAEGPAGDATCGNQVDDDCDGLTDMGDHDCSGVLIEWIQIPGGAFMMGSDSGFSNELPVHSVTVPSFEMSKSEVTVDQYQACVDAGICSLPDDNATNSYCNWGYEDRGSHPVNCIDWNQAVAFCAWAGGRLPSEAEWEYAARSGGQDITYPWGDEEATCQYAVMDDGGGAGCGQNRTWAVCSKTAGNTFQGLCDMAGNMWEWVQDGYHDDYTEAPVDGSAWEDGGSFRVIRGGALYNSAAILRVSLRSDGDLSYRGIYLGFRCAR